MDFIEGCSDFRTITFPVALSLYQAATQSDLHASAIQQTQDDVAYLESSYERQLTELTPIAPIITQNEIETSFTLISNPTIEQFSDKQSIAVNLESMQKFDKFNHSITKPQTVNYVVAIKSSPRFIQLQPHTNSLVRVHELIPNTQQSVPFKPETPKIIKSFHFARMASLPQVEFKSEHSLHVQLYKTLDHKMFACPVDGCGKAFKTRSDCTRHVRIHSDGRPFQCTWPDCYYPGGKDRTTALNHIRRVHFKIDVRAAGSKTSKYGDPKAYLKVIKELL